MGEEHTHSFGQILRQHRLAAGLAQEALPEVVRATIADIKLLADSV